MSAETTTDLDALPEGTTRLDKQGRERVKGRFELWYLTQDADKPDRVGITSFEMPHTGSEDAAWTVQDVIAQFDAHPYVPPVDEERSVVRLSVNLAPTVADALRGTAGAQGVSITEAIRRAIAVYAALHDEQAAGRALLIKDGITMREFMTAWQDPERP